MKDLAKMRETEEKIQRAKEAQEKREREKKEKAARKKALVDITAGTLDSLRFNLMFVFVIFNPATGQRKFIFACCYNKNHNSANTYRKNVNYISFYCQMNSLL